VSLARPQFGAREGSRSQTGRDVLVLLDLSRSMNAGDVPGSRLQTSKATVVELLSRSRGSRYGLIVFGGSAFLQLPLTTDLGAFRRFLEAGTTDDLANPATDLSRALSAAVTTFEHEGERGYQAVVLVSDGESMEGDIGPVLKRLQAMSVPVFSLGVGTEAGAPIPADGTQSTSGESCSRVSTRESFAELRSKPEERIGAGHQESEYSLPLSWTSWRSEPSSRERPTSAPTSFSGRSVSQS
jgi:Ca-activated chloride channel family protein